MTDEATIEFHQEVWQAKPDQALALCINNNVDYYALISVGRAIRVPLVASMAHHVWWALDEKCRAVYRELFAHLVEKDVQLLSPFNDTQQPRVIIHRDAGDGMDLPRFDAPLSSGTPVTEQHVVAKSQSEVTAAIMYVVYDDTEEGCRVLEQLGFDPGHVVAMRSTLQEYGGPAVGFDDAVNIYVERQRRLATETVTPKLKGRIAKPHRTGL